MQKNRIYSFDQLHIKHKQPFFCVIHTKHQVRFCKRWTQTTCFEHDDTILCMKLDHRYGHMKIPGDSLRDPGVIHEIWSKKYRLLTNNYSTDHKPPTNCYAYQRLLKAFLNHGALGYPTQGHTQGGLGLPPPLSLIFYKKFNYLRNEINCFRIHCLLISRLNVNTTDEICSKLQGTL